MRWIWRRKQQTDVTTCQEPAKGERQASTGRQALSTSDQGTTSKHWQTSTG